MYIIIRWWQQFHIPEKASTGYSKEKKPKEQRFTDPAKYAFSLSCMDSQFQMPLTQSLQTGIKKQQFGKASDQKFNVII